MKKYALILALAICVGVGGWFMLHQDTPAVEETTNETINEETPEITADPVDTEETTETETPVEETPVVEDAGDYTIDLSDIHPDMITNFQAAHFVMGSDVDSAVGFLTDKFKENNLECPDNLEELYKEFIGSATGNSNSGSSSSNNNSNSSGNSSSGSNSSGNSSSGSTTTQKPVEQKPVEQKPVEQKPVEQPVEQKPVEQPSYNEETGWELPDGWNKADGGGRPDGLPTDGSGDVYSPDYDNDITVIG